MISSVLRRRRRRRRRHKSLGTHLRKSRTTYYRIFRCRGDTAGSVDKFRRPFLPLLADEFFGEDSPLPLPPAGADVALTLLSSSATRLRLFPPRSPNFRMRFARREKEEIKVSPGHGLRRKAFVPDSRTDEWTR